MKTFLSLCAGAALCLLASCSEGPTKQMPYNQGINVIPTPVSLVLNEGSFKLNKNTAFSVSTPEAKTVAEYFATQMNLATGYQITVSDKAASNGITLAIDEALDVNDEGYTLDVTPQGVTVKAKTPQGLFYGMQTFMQLLPAEIQSPAVVNGIAWTASCVTVKDEPRFEYRGIMLDPCRHFIPVENVKKHLDVLALFKINRMHWHLTDDQGWRIEIKKYPKLTEVGSKRIDGEGTEYSGFYTQDQIKEVVKYAADRFITIVPEIELPGHELAAISAYPELSCKGEPTTPRIIWGVEDIVLCAGKEKTFEFLQDVFDEVAPLFPSEYIHIGGDECPKSSWKECPLCQKRIREEGLKADKNHSAEEKLQSYFVTRMEKYLNSKGRNIIGWDEILEGGLAPNATVMSWRGVEGGMNAAKAGHNAIMTPNPYVYLDYYQEEPEIAPTTIGGYNTLKKTYSYNPVPDDADELAKKHIIGIQGNIWREYMQTSERTDYQAFPRAMAIAETAWTQNANKDWKNFCERMVTEFERLEVMNTKPCLNFFDVNVNTHADENTPLMVMLESFYPNAEIRYTTDGSEPSKTSTVYEKPFVLEGNIDLKAAAFKDGKMLGKVAHKPLYGNLLTGKPYTVNYKMGWTGDIFDENDVLGADKTTFGLTNGKRGNNASYTPWCSFGIVEGKDLEFIVNLDKPTQISKIIFGSLFNPAMRILPAGGVAVEVSADGKQYTPVAEKALKHDYPETGRIAFTDSIEFEPTQATFLKVKIKNGGTLRNGVNFEKNNGPEVIPAELWIDEIEAY